MKTNRTVKKILICDRFTPEALALFSSHADIDVHHELNPKPSAELLADAYGLIIRSRTRVDEALLAMAPNLKVIVSATSGFDHIDLKATQARAIAVMNTPDANTESAAELTFGLVLACARRISQAHRMVKAGEWAREQLLGVTLSGKTYGIVGLGRIGKKVARLAQGFGMKVLAFDPYVEDQEFTMVQAQRVSYEELLKLSDVVSFHVPKSDETRHMLNASQFTYLHPEVILVNTSRGEVINENDLIDALADKQLGAVGLDVFEKEPLARHSGLNSLSNVVLTPHIGANTVEAFAEASRAAAEKVIAYVASQAISDSLPPNAAWMQGGFKFID